MASLDTGHPCVAERRLLNVGWRCMDRGGYGRGWDELVIIAAAVASVTTVVNG